MRVFSIVLACALLLLSGCVAVTPSANGFAEVDPKDVEAVAIATTSKENYNRGVIKYDAPIVFEKNNILNSFYNLRGWRDSKTKKFIGAQIYLSIPTTKWAFYNSAFSGGKSLDVTTIDKSVGSCSEYGCRLTEIVGINLSVAQLKQFSEEGFIGEVSGKRGALPVVIPKEYFTGFLKVFG